MAKGPIVTSGVEALIASTYQKHPKWKAPEVRKEVSFLLRKNNPKLLLSWPSLSKVQKVLAKVRKKNKLPPDPKDEPFCLGALVKPEYNIPPEALPTVLRAWAQYHKQGDTFTIREALWFSRLSSVLFDKVGEKNRNLENSVLLEIVQWYARREQAYEAIEKVIDTTDIDLVVLRSLKLIEEEQEDTTRLVVEGDYLKDSTGKIRGQIRALNEAPYQPKAKENKGGKP